MELDIINQEDNEIRFELKQEDHTFANLLVDTLQDMEEVKIAQYDMKHPQISSPNIYLETNGEEPKTVLKKAIEKIQETMQDLQDDL